MNFQLIDSHCHLDFPKFDTDRDETIGRAYKNGVEQIINSGVDLKTNLSSLKLAEKYKNINATLGFSPHLAISANDKEVRNIIDFIVNNVQNAVAIGEAGLDYYYFKTVAERNKQINVFKKIIEIAENCCDKPLVIHGREAEDVALKMTKHLDKVIFHCYGGTLETMNKIINAGHFISVPTLVCFSKHHQEIVRNLPLENMLLETDSPYLSPYKGRNEPAFIVESLKWIEKIKNIEMEEIATITRKNTINIFNL